MRLLGKVFSRQTLVTTNHCISSLIRWRAIGYRLGRGKIAGCPLPISGCLTTMIRKMLPSLRRWLASSIYCHSNVTPRSQPNREGWRPLFFGAKRPLTPKSHQPDTTMLLKPLFAELQLQDWSKKNHSLGHVPFIWMFPKIGVPPNHPFWKGFHHKPSILGYPYFWKHPFMVF